MCSHPVGLDIWFLVGPLVYFHTSCMCTAKALTRLHRCTDFPEPSPVTYVISKLAQIRLRPASSAYRSQSKSPTDSEQAWSGTLPPAKTQISLGIRPVWSKSSLSAWRKLESLAMLIWVFVGCTLILLVLSCHGSFDLLMWCLTRVYTVCFYIQEI